MWNSVAWVFVIKNVLYQVISSLISISHISLVVETVVPPASITEANAKMLKLWRNNLRAWKKLKSLKFRPKACEVKADKRNEVFYFEYRVGPEDTIVCQVPSTFCSENNWSSVVLFVCEKWNTILQLFSNDIITHSICFTLTAKCEVSNKTFLNV